MFNNNSILLVNLIKQVFNPSSYYIQYTNNTRKNLLNTTSQGCIYLFKKAIWWGIILFFLCVIMSDNIHYVNLIKLLRKNKVKVGNTFYFLLKYLDLPRPSQIIPNKIKRCTI